jgi:MFS family permease
VALHREAGVDQSSCEVVSAADDPQIADIRAAFFERTRKTVLILYVALAVAAVCAAAVGLTSDALRAAAGLAAGFLVALILFAASSLFRVSARAARVLIGAGAVAGIVAAQIGGGIGAALGAATLEGAFAGFMAGTVLGIVRIRRRLAWDDELLLRQKQLGFDPEHPYGWLRSGSKADN